MGAVSLLSNKSINERDTQSVHEAQRASKVDLQSGIPLAMARQSDDPRRMHDIRRPEASMLQSAGWRGRRPAEKESWNERMSGGWEDGKGGHLDLIARTSWWWARCPSVDFFPEKSVRATDSGQ